MEEKIAYWASMVLGGLALVLLILNISLINGNRNLQESINQRQATINAGATLNQLSRGLVQALAEAANNNDSAIRDLLAAQGITVTAKTGDRKKADNN